MADDSGLVPALVFAEVVGVEGEVYAVELAALAEAGILLPTTSLRPDGGESITASGLALEFPTRLTDAQVARLIELKSSCKHEPKYWSYPLLPSHTRAERVKDTSLICGIALVPAYFFGGLTHVALTVLVTMGVVVTWEALLFRRYKGECRKVDEVNSTVLEAWRRDTRFAELARESLTHLARSEFTRTFGAIQSACIEAVRDCIEAFAKEQRASTPPIAWLASCVADDGNLAVCKWNSGAAILKDSDAEGGVVCIQHSGLTKVQTWFCDYERALLANDMEAQEKLRTRPKLVSGSEKLDFFAKWSETNDPGGVRRALGFNTMFHKWPIKPKVPVWLEYKPGVAWADLISFSKGEVHLSRSKSRKPKLRISLLDLASIQREYKALIRAAIDGVVDAKLPELASSFKERLFQCVDEVCAQPTPRTAAESANLKVLAAKVVRTDAAVQALFAKLMTDPEFGAYFEIEAASTRAERELRVLEAKVVAEAELREREVKALELKLAEDAKLERDRVEAEIELRKEHLALKSKKQSELLEQLRRQADAAEDAVTMTRYQLQAMHEQTDATRRVAKEIEKQERKNRGEWSILDDWFGG